LWKSGRDRTTRNASMCRPESPGREITTDWWSAEGPSMRQSRRSKVDPIEQQMELSLSPGRFMRDGESLSFAGGLEKVAGIQILIATDAARAAGAGDKEQPLFVEPEKARWGGGRAGGPSGRLRRERPAPLDTALHRRRTRSRCATEG